MAGRAKAEQYLKAARLIAGGKIREIPSAHVFSVRDGEYVVTVSAVEPFGHCTCPATGECYHIMAARGLVLGIDDDTARGAWTESLESDAPELEEEEER